MRKKEYLIEGYSLGEEKSLTMEMYTDEAMKFLQFLRLWEENPRIAEFMTWFWYNNISSGISVECDEWFESFF